MKKMQFLLPRLRMKTEIDSIRFLNSTTAVEEGRVALTPQPPQADRVISRYIAIHTLKDKQWLMASVHDTRVELPPDYGQLADLGSVDKKTQRAAWTIGDNKENVIETGIYNLTKDDVPCLVHSGKDKSEQWTLVRLNNDDSSSSSGSVPMTSAVADTLGGSGNMVESTHNRVDSKHATLFVVPAGQQR